MEYSLIKQPGLERANELLELHEKQGRVTYEALLNVFVDCFGEEHRETLEGLNLFYEELRGSMVLYDQVFDSKGELVPDKARYLLLYPWGYGGMADVYKAIDIRLSSAEETHWVAVKIPKSNKNEEPPLWNRFQREAKAMAKLPKGFTLFVYDMKEDSDHQYLIMDWIGGGNGSFLYDYILDNTSRGNFIELENVWKIAKSLYEKTKYLHDELQENHRDLAPQNIVITKEGEAQLADFGVAKNVVGAGLDEPSKNAFYGRLDYVPVEEFFSGFDSEERNRYVLTLLVYEMLTGKPFHKRNIEEWVSVAGVLKGGPMEESFAPARKTMLSQDQRVVNSYGLKRAKEIEVVLDKALSKKEGRYQNDSELLADLEACLTQSNSEPLKP